MEFRFDHDNDFPFGWACSEVRQEACGESAAVLFVEFGQFSCNDDEAVREDVMEFLQQLGDAIRGFIEDEGPGDGGQGGDLASALGAFVGQETNKVEFSGGQTARGERGDERARAGDGFHTESGVEHFSNDAFARITDGGTACVGHHGDPLALSESFNEVLRAACLIEVVAAEERLVELIMTQQLRRVTGIFRGNRVAFLERAQRAKRDIFEVADGSGNEVEGRRLERGALEDNFRAAG